MKASALVTHFLDGSLGRLMVVMHKPQAPVGCGVLMVAPFAEEMNKTRKMLADVGRALATRGIGAVLVDPYGTGDSEGEFVDATWECWVQDLVSVASWAAEAGSPIEGLLGVRLGCALGAKLARDALHGIRRTVFWQPVIEGSKFLNQFLRLRVAASMMGGARETMAELRQALNDDRPIEVAGYELPPGLAREIDKLNLPDLLGTHLGRLHWMEVARDAERVARTPGNACIESARARGLETVVRTVSGPPFWSSTEIVRIAELVDCTVEALADLARQGAAAASSFAAARH